MIDPESFATSDELKTHYRDVRRRLHHSPTPEERQKQSVIIANVPTDRRKFHPVYFSPTQDECLRERNRICVRMVIRETASYFGMKVDELLSERRTNECVIPRQICFYLLRTVLHRSMSDIGVRLNKDHTSVLHGINRTKLKMRTSKTFLKQVNELRSIILFKSSVFKGV